jgi:hypothetical protein
MPRASRFLALLAASKLISTYLLYIRIYNNATADVAHAVRATHKMCEVAKPSAAN